MPGTDGDEYSQFIKDCIVFGAANQIRADGDVHISPPPPYRIFEAPVRAEPLSAVRARAQPSTLLLARHAVVPFTGRDGLLQDLSGWLGSDERATLRLVHGAGGQGKTRLAARLAADARANGWRVIHAMHRNPSNAASVIPRTPGDLLVVIDYADRWPVEDLAMAMGVLGNAAEMDGRLLRVLCLARSAGYWWSTVAGPANTDFDATATETALMPLGDEVDREWLFSAATEAFAEILEVNPIQVPTPHLMGPEFAQVLAVHMAALASIDAMRTGEPALTDPRAISEYLLQREHVYWQKLYDRDANGSATPPTVMARTVFTATLTGAMPRGRAAEVLHEVGLVADPAQANNLIDNHRGCYPPALDTEVLEPLHPDRLGEDLVATCVPGVDAVASDDWSVKAPWNLVAGTRDGRVMTLPEHTPRVIAVLVESARRWPHVGQRLLFPLLRDQPWLVFASGNAAMTRLATMPGAPVDVLEAVESTYTSWFTAGLETGAATIAQRLASHRLETATDAVDRARLKLTLGSRLADAQQWPEAVELYREAIGYLRPLADSSAECRTLLASATRELGATLARVCEYDGALASATEAVELYLSVSNDSTGHGTGLAAALANLGSRLDDVGRWREALEATQDAVEVCHELLTSDPGVALSLATNLARLSAMHLGAGQYRAAAHTASEAVELLREQAQTGAASPVNVVLEPPLAVALNNLAAAWLQLGEYNEAMDATTRLIAVRRHLAEQDPGSYEGDLAGSLRTQAAVLISCAQWGEAVRAAAESVDILRRLAERYPFRYQADLAGSLTALSAALAEWGRWGESVAATAEAIAIYRRLAARYPARFETALATNLANYGAQLAVAGQVKEAYGATKDAVAIYRRLATGDALASEENFALALNNLGNEQVQRGEHVNAVATLSEALDIYRRLADDNPGLEKDLARALSNLCGAYRGTRQLEEAISAGIEAVEVLRRLGQEHLETTAPQLAEALASLGVAHLAANKGLAALQSLNEAVEILRSLVVVNPKAYEPRLVAALGNHGLIAASGGLYGQALQYTQDALRIANQLADRQPNAHAATLASALHLFARVRLLALAELPEALDAARRSETIYRQLHESDPAWFGDGPRHAREAVAEIEQAIAAHSQQGEAPADAMQLLVADTIRQRLDDDGLAQLCASLFPEAGECQTRGDLLGAGQLTLHVDELGEYAEASLHHPACRRSAGWNRADQHGVLTVRVNSLVRWTWQTLCIAVPFRGWWEDVRVMPVVLLNPSLEAVRLERDERQRWRPRVRRDYCDAGLVPFAELPEGPAGGVTARLVADEVEISVSGQAYRAPYPPPGQPLTPKTDRLLLAVTHAVNPASGLMGAALSDILNDDRTVVGWVELPGTRPRGRVR